MIDRFFTTTFTTKRQTWSGDSSSLVEQEDFIGHLQQGVSKTYQENIQFRFSKAWTIWCPADTDVQEGDRLEEGSNTYDVKFVIDRNLGRNRHLELIVEKHG